MRTVVELFDEFDGPANVARAIGVSTEHAAAMKRRGSIPARYWLRIVEVAQAKRIDGLTLEALAHIHAKERAAS